MMSITRPIRGARSVRGSPPRLFHARSILMLLNVVAVIGITTAALNGDESAARKSTSAKGRKTTVNARGADAASNDPKELYKQGQFAESTKDYVQAVRFYRKAAMAGHEDSQNNLGYLLLRGLGVDRNEEEAVRWFREAARSGHLQAQNNLGICYRDGSGVEEDQVQAAKWFMQAAEKGLAEAQNNLGVRFYRGQGMPKNTDEAMKWFNKAAEQGSPQAFINIGITYVEGRGNPKDLNKAFEWFSKAAEKGDGDGLLSLGWAHMEGKGVPKDLVRAYICFNTAVSYGDTYAPQARTRLRMQMTEKQVAEAQRKSYREFAQREK